MNFFNTFRKIKTYKYYLKNILSCAIEALLYDIPIIPFAFVGTL